MHAATILLFFTYSMFLGAPSPAHSEAKSTPPISTQVDTTAPMTLQDEKSQETVEQMLGTHVGVMGILSSNLNFEGGHSIDMLLVQGELHWTDPRWRFIAHPRIKVRPVGTVNGKSSVFFQEVFASFREGDLAELKVGKIYEQFGRAWDYGVYGPLVGNTDLKLRPDIGFSLEGAPAIQRNLSVAYALQYFVVDGQAVSIRPGWSLDTSARHKHIVVGRVAPTLQLDELGTIAVGVSGKRHTSYGEDSAGHQVLTAAGDINYSRGPLDTFFEVGYQHGSSAALASLSNNYSDNDSIDPYTYLWAGAAYDIASFNVRFNLSASFYRDAPGSVEMLYQPGIGYRIGDNRELEIALEGVFWSSSNPLARAEIAPGWIERAVYLVAVGHI